MDREYVTLLTPYMCSLAFKYQPLTGFRSLTYPLYRNPTLEIPGDLLDCFIALLFSPCRGSGRRWMTETRAAAVTAVVVQRVEVRS